MRASTILAFFCSVLFAPLQAAAGEGVTSDSVRFAQVAALEGPAAELGLGMRAGIVAAFEEANRNGGIHGRKVALDSVDDGYEPGRTAAQAHDIIKADNHLGFVGTVGTSTAKTLQPLASQAGMPIVGPMTGADFLRAPWATNIVNIRASYLAEAEALVAHLVDGLGLSRIAVLYQDDGFGRTGHDGVAAALARRDLELLASGSYTRNTTAVKVSLLRIRKAGPEAVIIVGTRGPAAAFIRLARSLDVEATFATISSVNATALGADLGRHASGVIVSQVVPSPGDDSLPVAITYQAALKAVDPAAEPDSVSFEGYLAGRAALAALEAAGPWLTRERYLAALADLGEIDLGGLQLTFGPGDNQGLDQVFLTRIAADGGVEPVAPAPQG